MKNTRKRTSSVKKKGPTDISRALSCCRFLLLVVDDLVVGFDHVVSGLAARVRPCGRASGLTSLRLRAGLTLLLIERLPGLAEHLGQLFLRRANLSHVVPTERLAGPLDGGIDFGLRVRSDLVPPLLHVLLDFVRHRVETIPSVDRFALLLVLGRVLFRVLDHAVDLAVGESARSFDADLLLLASCLVLRG